MKKTILLISAISLMSLSAMASEKKLIKSCSTVFQMPGESNKIDAKVEIFRNKDSSLVSTLTQTTDGITTSEDEVATVATNSVRPGLVGELSEDETLNEAEQLISHAMLVSEDPMFEGMFSTGIDLKKVRSAKVYTVGESTNLGTSAIVEAKDKNGKILGSFVGGFLVSPCK